MKALRINPKTHTVEEFDFDDSLKTIQEEVEGYFTTFPLGENMLLVHEDDSYVPTQLNWTANGCRFRGKALIVGPTTCEGRTSPCTMSLTEAENLIKFLEPKC